MIHAYPPLALRSDGVCGAWVHSSNRSNKHRSAKVGRLLPISQLHCTGGHGCRPRPRYPKPLQLQLSARPIVVSFLQLSSCTCSCHRRQPHPAGLGILAVRSMTRAWPEVTLRGPMRMRRRGSAGQCLVTAIACVNLNLRISNRHANRIMHAMPMHAQSCTTEPCCMTCVCASCHGGRSCSWP
jgi:hypothetical protein